MTATVTHSGSLILVVAVFLASAVEMVEALTIVLAVGLTRSWRTALQGAVAAVLVLAALVVAVGPTLVHLVPLTTLRLVIGGLLLVFGLQWLRKAILRASGRKAKHDEDAIFAEHVAELEESAPAGRWDGTGFTVAFKGVFLEGLEVVVIVLTLGSTSHDLGLAAVAAGSAVVVVAAVGLVVARQLSSVPENAMKMAVGLMLVSFGTFWCGESVGVHWPGADLDIVALVAFYGVVAAVSVAALQRRGSSPAMGVFPSGGPTPPTASSGTPVASAGEPVGG